MDAGKLAMIEKVMKLLELGKDGNGAYTPEMEAANDMAAKLMAKYSIDFADLREGKIKTNIFERQKVEPQDDDYCGWEACLAAAIAEAFDCHVVTSKRNPTWFLNFCGTKSDLEISIFFYRHLRRTVGRKSEIEYSRQGDRKTYAYGMVSIISQRLNDLYKRRQDVMESDCKALVVVKKDGVKKFVADEFPNLRKSRGERLNGNHSAYQKGIDDGKKVNLSRPISNNGGASPKAIH